MASMIIEKSSSSSSSSSWKYDVFLSFRGEDTRKSFTDHLYAALKQKGIYTFRDDEKLERGKSISPELLKAIEESRFAIVIFSKNYASSTWCLEELEKIVECMEEKRMAVLPVFYDVDPSDVRKQSGTFAQAFVEYEERFKKNIEKVQTWRYALIEVANLSGWNLNLKDRPETRFIQEIVEVISNKLGDTFQETTKRLVGINSRVEELKSLLAIGLNDIRIIGIWGTAGVGKTTIAKAVYERISHQFEACSFIDNVREVSEKDGLFQLQKKLLNELLVERDENIHDVDVGFLKIKNRLRHKRILLVLDDVNELDQLEKLAGEHNWFGQGSRIIITTRDLHFLLNHEANEIYEVKAMNDDEALELFSWKAFKKDQPAEDYVQLSQDFLHYAEGLPLAIEVLGSILFDRSIHEWKSELDKLRDFPEIKILNILQLSFDRLDAREREIFLDIACFFNHKHQDSVTKILNYLEVYPIIGLKVLVEKSLLKLNNNHLWMHDLLQEMGRNMVRQECPQDPGKRSRLWFYKDIDNVLTKNTGTKAIQGIVLQCFGPKEVDWNPEAFLKMRNLKLLQIWGAQPMHDLKHLPYSIRFLDWSAYPSKSLPSSFHSDELVELHMHCSYLERLWDERKCFKRLKFIHLDRSLKLIETPDFTEVPILEKLSLEDCINLRELHPSIGFQKKLTLLNLKGCKNLKDLPSKFEMKSLEILNLSGCSKVKKIPEFGKNMERVLMLYLDGTAITKLPTSIEHLTGLASLNLRDCKNLVSLPSTIYNLKLLKDMDISGCSKLERLATKLGNAESIEELDVSGTAIRHMPSKWLTFHGCEGPLSSNKSWYELLTSFYSKLRSPIPVGLLPLSYSLIELKLRDCNVKVIPNDIGSLCSLELLDLSGNDFVCLPESIDQLSNLKKLWLDNCTSLRSLPKLPLNIWYMGARGCSSLQMLPDQLKVTKDLHFDDCFKLTATQDFTDMYIAMIKKYLQGLLSPQDVNDMNIVIPGSEIPKWFSHQRIGSELYIKEPSHLCNDWIGIVVCAVFCSKNCGRLYFSLIVNGNQENHRQRCTIEIFKRLSDHLWLIYVSPDIFNDEWIKSVMECDTNGFCQIGIRIHPLSSFDSTFEVKKCGLRMVYKKDIEDLIQTTAQCSNNITPYEGLGVHHNFDSSTVVEEGNKVKRSYDDYDGAGRSGEGSSNDVPHPKKIKSLTEFMFHESVRDKDLTGIPESLFTVKGSEEQITLEPQGVMFDVEAADMTVYSSEADQHEEARYILMGGLGLTEPPKDEDWENAKEINLMNNELSVLPENPRCPKLSALFLQRNYKLRTIPPSFFDHMPALHVLNLSRTGIKSLPDSIIRLVNLKRLFLNDCHLFMMLSPKVGELKQLEVLDLEGTEIMHLPQEIKNLTNLTCLDVSFYEYKSNGRRTMQSNAVVPCGVISALSQLEELNIDVDPDDKRWDACVEAIVYEVCTLKRLETLKFYFPNVELLRHIQWNISSLLHFRFTVGYHVRRIMSRVPRDVEFELERRERCLKYLNGVGVPRDIKKVLQHSTAFFLDRHVTVKKLSEFGIGNMKQLKCCVVGECDEVQVIIDEGDAYEEDDISKIVSDSHGTEKIVLGSLEYLYIYFMKSLRSIWTGSVQQNSLFLLKSLTLNTCPQLTTIFSQGLLANLCNLEELKVEDCPCINSIVSCEISAEHKASYFLPNLKKILLHYMPGLISICSGLHIAPKLEWLSFYDCPNLKNPLIDEVSTQDLKKIKGERSWWEALEWSNGCPGFLDEIFVPIGILDC